MSIPAHGAVGAETMTAGPKMVLLPMDDPSQPLHHSGLPSAMIRAGGDAFHRLKRDHSLVADSCSLAVGIYRAMTEAHAKEIATLTPPAALASPRADSDERTAGETLKEACKPWEHYTGEPPDDGSPLSGVFVAGMVYTERLLAKLLDVTHYEGGDGSEDFDSDATQTLRNILTGARLWDADENRPISATPAQPAGAVPDSLRALSEAARQGEWKLEELKNHGTSVSDQFVSYGIDCGGHTILDTLNSGGGFLEQEPADDDIGPFVWDEQARRDLTFIVELVSAYRSGALLASHPAGQSELPILRVVVEVYPDRTDTRLTFGDRIRPEPGVKAVEQAISALQAEFDGRNACPAIKSSKRSPQETWISVSALQPQQKAMLGRWSQGAPNEDGSPYFYWQQCSGRYFDFQGERHWCLDGRRFEGAPFYGESPTHALIIAEPPPHGSWGNQVGQSEDDVERCIACDKPLKAGELVLPDAEGGTIHTACCGPERESYTGADGGPLAPNDPIPQGYVYEGEQPTGQERPDRKWVCNGDPAQPAGAVPDGLRALSEAFAQTACCASCTTPVDCYQGKPCRLEPAGSGSGLVDHEFKSHPDVFWPAARGEKTFEYRRDDRGGYEVGQTVRLRCYDPTRGYHDTAPLDRRITNILRGGEFELPMGYCILSLAPLSTHPAGQSAGSGAETDALVDRFSAALKVKLRAAEAKYGWKNGWLKSDWQVECQNGLLRHVGKGDPLDVAAYAAFCWHHGWPSASRRSTDLVTGAVIPTAGAIAAYETRYPDGSLSETSDNTIEAWNRVAAAVCLAEKPAPDSTRTGAAETEEDWREDPSADERWCAGVDYAQEQLCHVLGVDPSNVNWDAATETLDGDMQAVICTILAAWGGDDWQALAARPEAPSDAGWRSQAADEIDAIADLWSGDGRSYAKTIAAILRSEEPEQLPPADAETRRQVQRAWERFKAGTSTPPSDPAPSGQVEG